MGKAVIFDMDGTLFDTERLICEMQRQVSHKYGEREDVDTFYPTTCGVTLATAKQMYEDFFGAGYPFFERREEVYAFLRTHVEEHGVPIKTGALELLQFLKDHGYKIALATSSIRSYAAWLVGKAKLEPFFDVMVFGDDITRSKPHPEIFLVAAERMGVCPKNCVVVEDSYFGVEAGAAADMTVCMVPDMRPPRQKEKELAHHICENLCEIIPFLEKKA